MFRGGSSPQNF